MLLVRQTDPKELRPGYSSRGIAAMQGENLMDRNRAVDQIPARRLREVPLRCVRFFAALTAPATTYGSERDDSVDTAAGSAQEHPAPGAVATERTLRSSYVLNERLLQEMKDGSAGRRFRSQAQGK